MAELLIDTQQLVLHLEESGDSDGKIRFKGEFGRVDKPTANNRFYSPKLMERELKRLSKSISEKKMLGELDHPCLTSDDFRVLTLDGWKQFRDVEVSDEVWSRVDGNAVVSTVEDVVDEPYMGPAIHFKGRSIDATFTSPHRFLTVKRPDRDGHGEEEYILAGDLAETMGKHVHDAIPKTATWFSEGVETFVVPGVSTPQSYKCKNDVTKDLHIDAKVFAAFMGVYLAEGNCSSDSTDTYAVFVHQRPGWSANYIYDEVLSKFPEEIQWTYDGKSFYTADARLRSYLKPLGNVYEKHIPSEIKSLGQECLNELVFWFGIGDGRMVASNGKSDHGLAEDGKTFKEVAAERLRNDEVTFTRRDVFSVSERLVRDLHECVVRSGGAGVVSVIEQVGDREIEGRVIKEENRRPLFQLHIGHSKNIWLDPRFLKTETVQHDGNIYCLKTTHGNFYMERGGHAWWTGNSDGRTRLQRVSHVITQLDVSKTQVIGEAHPIDTPNGRILIALAKAGIVVGVSSRGYGSTNTRHDGVEEVADDYRLDTYDFVFQPADETAYPNVYTEEKRLVQNLEDGTMELTLEVLKEKYPELVEMISNELRGTLLSEEEHRTSAVTEAVAETERRVERRLKEQFSADILKHVERVQEQAVEQARSEAASDPTVAGALGIVEQIATIISPFGASTHQREAIAEREERIAKLEASLAERELEVHKSAKEAKEMGVLAKEAAYALHVEQRLRGESDERRKAVINLIGDLKQFNEREAVDARFEAVCSELDTAKPEVEGDERSEFEERISSLEQGHNEMKEKAEAAAAEVESANDRTRRALDAAQAASTQAYAEGVAKNHPQGGQILKLAKSSTMIEEVDTIVAGLTEAADDGGSSGRRLDEDEAEKIRKRIAQGKERDLHEDEHGRPATGDNGGNGKTTGDDLLESMGLENGEFDRLAGHIRQ